MIDERRRPLTLLVAAGAIFSGWALLGPLAPAAAQVPTPPDLVAACGTANPFLVTVCYSQSGTAVTAPLRSDLVVYRDTPGIPNARMVTSTVATGALWGLAFDADAPAVFAAAFHKRFAPFGTGGTGAVYRIALDGTTDLAAVVPGAGPDNHASVAGTADEAARDWAGKVSLGDIELSADSLELYAVNLADRRIYRHALPGGTLAGSFDHGAVNEPWADDARPFGLAMHGGRLYHGVVNTAESSQAIADLAGYVYSSLADGSDMRFEASFALGGSRGVAWLATPGGTDRVPIDWRPWRDGHSTVVPTSTVAAIYPQPVLSDLELDERGNLIVALRDRQSDMTLFRSVPVGTGVEAPGIGLGDLIRVPMLPSGFGAADPEYFADRNALADDSATGGISYMQAAGLLASGSTDIEPLTGGGPIGRAIWHAAANGDRVAFEDGVCAAVVAGAMGPGSDPKDALTDRVAPDFGDLEALCAPAMDTPPAETATASATSTPAGTPTAETPPSPPTETANPPRTETATPPQTETITPPPTETAGPTGTNTAPPTPTNTAPPPTDTPEPPPTDTVAPPPTDTPAPPPTDTPAPPPATPTRPSPVNTPSATSTEIVLPDSRCVCDAIRHRVPSAVINDAIVNPYRYRDFRVLLNPNRPAGPDNPRRECLTLSHLRRPYHPMWNPPVWTVGCP